MKKRALIVVGAGSLAAAAIVLWGTLSTRSDGSRISSQAEATYVGRDACAACHDDETALWAGSHHDLAMQEATEATVLGDFNDATLTHRGITSTFYRQDGSFYARTEGPDGELEDYAIAYTFGVAPLQQYLVAFPGGRNQVLGIAWDSRPEADGGQRWFHLYPEMDTGPDDPLHWTRPPQNWNNMCAECHSTHIVKGYDLESRSYQTTWSEIDVSCEACHGPGSSHVRIAETESRDESDQGRGDWGLVANVEDRGRAWTFAPGATTAARSEPNSSASEIESCAHCHSRRATLAEGWVAGQPLLDFDLVSLLREDLYHADGQILGEVYVYGSFVQSKMYAAGVTCSDCHDPHSLAPRAEGNALCTRCHLPSTYDDPSHYFHEATSAGAQCVECHMPATTYMVVDPRRDHSLRIPRPDLSETIGVPNACNGCHLDQSVEWAARTAERWWGPVVDSDRHFGEAIHAGRVRDPGAATALADLAEDTTKPGIARASALALLPSYPPSAASDAIRAGLTDADPLVRLGALRAIEGLPTPGGLTLVYPLIDDPVRSIRIEAARLLASVPRASLTPEQTTTIDRGVLEYERTQLANADHPSSLVNLGILYTARGQLEAAENAYRTALVLDDTYLPALLNLADVFRARGRDDLGEETLLAALEQHPEASELHHAVGLLKVREGNLDEALSWLERAASSSPENVRFTYVYGVALGSSGELAQAVQVLDGALVAHPFDRDLLTGLATYSRDLGELDAAIGYAKRLVEVLPDDAGARQLLSQLSALRR